MELAAANETYECYCRGNINNNVKITLVNKNTGEKQEFKSMYSCAKAIGKNPGSVPYIKKK